jgi:hypothetical protein
MFSLKPKRFRAGRFTTGIIALLVAATAAADRIELNDGSVINGKLKSAEGGLFKFETAFAGTIVIAQEQIRTFETQTPIHVGLRAGTQVLGTVASERNGVALVARDGRITTAPSEIAAIWQPGEDSPDVRIAKELAAKAARTWAYEAAVSINGRTGVSEKFNAAAAFKATLASDSDKLMFTLAAEKADDNGVETANRQAAAVEYSSFSTAGNGWYARTMLEKDKIKLLDLRSTTAFGFARRLIKTEVQELEGRVGVNYLYESYSTGLDFESPGLDLGLQHVYQFANSRMSNLVTFTPAFEDFANYRAHHESAWEMPITASLWKLRIGVANDYTSQPPPGVEKLDTTYFTSLILNWK